MNEQDRLKQRDEQVDVIQSTLRETLERLESTSAEVCCAAILTSIPAYA